MPWTVRNVGGGKVSVSSPGGVKAKATTKEKAEAQVNLLRAVEHGFVPTGKKRRRGKPKTNAERRRTHKAKYGTSTLPPRGTGLSD